MRGIGSTHLAVLAALVFICLNITYSFADPVTEDDIKKEIAQARKVVRDLKGKFDQQSSVVRRKKRGLQKILKEARRTRGIVRMARWRIAAVKNSLREATAHINSEMKKWKAELKRRRRARESSARIEEAKRAVYDTLRSKDLKPDDEVAVFVFSGCGGVHLLVPFTQDTEKAIKAVQGIRTGSGTPLAAGILTAGKYLYAGTKQRIRGLALRVTIQDGKGNVLGHNQARLAGRRVAYLTIFDRWNRYSSTKPFEIKLSFHPEWDASEPNDGPDSAAKIRLGRWYSAVLGA